MRGNPGNNGWNTAAPIGTQGAQFDVSTAGYSNIVCTFDLYFTSAGEAKMCVLYTTDAWATTNVASTLFYGAKPSFVQTNAAVALGGSENTVTGTYIYQTLGQNFYNNFVVDFTGVPGVENNPNFSFRIVNAATGSDCVAFNGGSYNNSSGNWRYDNVVVGGTSGTPAPTIAYDPRASVDAPFTNTFPDDAVWRSKIAAVYVNGLVLTNTAYTTNTAGQMVFTPSKSTLLQSSGDKNIVIIAAGYGTAKYVQPLAAGMATKLAITSQPAAPSASGGTLTVNPSLIIADQYGNGTTNPYPSVTITATANNSSWVLGGDTVQPAVDGLVVFTNLTATSTSNLGSVSNFLTFAVTGYAPVTTTNSASFNIGAAPVPFTPGNLAVLQIDTMANNTTFSVIELKPSAKQAAPLNIVPISATGTNALRLSSAGSCGKMSLSDDGTLLCFGAFADNSAATPDETLNLNRAAAGLNYTNQLVIGLNYISTSLGGSQARSCATLDNINWFADDKGGLYYGSAASGTLANPNLNPFNNVVIRTFGGVPYVETQKTANGQVIPVVYALGLDVDTGLYDVTKANNLTTDPVASDFYMISSDGSTYDTLYILDGVSATQGIIKKYSLVSGAWAANGTFVNATGGDSLFAATNGNGGVYLYYTTGSSTSNSLVRVTDAAGYNQSISIVSSNVLYTATGGTYLKGITFVPQQIAYTSELTPPPFLSAATSATVSSPFSVTNTPDVAAWRSAITGITVNGSALPAAAYSINQVGKIVFDPSQSALLQTAGSKTIVISATGFSTNSIVQTISAGTAAKLAITTQPTGPVADGGALATQPVIVVQDQFGNVTTSTASITAAPVQSTWTLGGAVTKAAVSGTATFSGLTAFSTNAVIGANIVFTSSGLASVTSSPVFNIPAPIQSILGGVNLGGGKLAFTFTNAAGLNYSIIATNDISAPIATWPVIGTAVEGPAGIYRFTNSIAATNALQFYMLRQP
ncbi:DUF1533 domain-containing protein [Pedosphaera parvula]|nr:DUF1533 domain-containing protein [Pedosphaera parvula]